MAFHADPLHTANTLFFSSSKVICKFLSNVSMKLSFRSLWRHHGANYKTSTVTSTPVQRISQYRFPANKPPPNNSAQAEVEETLSIHFQTAVQDLKSHYKHLDRSAREQALVRDLVHDWNERRLIAAWKYLESHPSRASEMVNLLGLDFGEETLSTVVWQGLRNLRKYPRRERFPVVARALQQTGNSDEVLGLDNSMFDLLRGRRGEGVVQ